MSTPSPMECLASECPSPLSCNDRGECRIKSRQGAREYEEGLRACREQGRKPFQQREESTDAHA